jgi:hypothetical protein
MVERDCRAVLGDEDAKAIRLTDEQRLDWLRLIRSQKRRAARC